MRKQNESNENPDPAAPPLNTYFLYARAYFHCKHHPTVDNLVMLMSAVCAFGIFYKNVGDVRHGRKALKLS